MTNEDELFVTEDGTHVCLMLSDHEADHRNMQRELAVRTGGGGVQTAWSVYDDTCESVPDEDPLPPCVRTYAGGDEEEETLPISGYVESRSPDGTWALVRVASVLGDVVHTQYVLYSDARAKAYPLPRDGASRWPKAVTLPADLDGEEYIEGLPEVAGSEAVHWVGPRHLVAGRTLFIAGKRIVPLDGDAAY